MIADDAGFIFCVPASIHIPLDEAGVGAEEEKALAGGELDDSGDDGEGDEGDGDDEGDGGDDGVGGDLDAWGDSQHEEDDDEETSMRTKTMTADCNNIAA